MALLINFEANTNSNNTRIARYEPGTYTTDFNDPTPEPNDPDHPTCIPEPLGHIGLEALLSELEFFGSAL